MPEVSIDFDAYRADGGYQLYDRLLAGEINAEESIESLNGTQLPVTGVPLPVMI